jgi:hypothetical protein
MKFLVSIVLMMAACNSQAAKRVLVADELKVGSYSMAYADQTESWQSYTPTTQGFGSPTITECKYKRDGDDLLVRCKFTIGTRTGVEARVGFPTGLTSDASKVTTIQICGQMAWGSSTTVHYHILCESNVNYFTFSYNSNAGLTKVNGNGFLADSSVVSMYARVPISGWSSGLTIRADQTNYDWTAYTPTFTGLGTPTAVECYHKRIARDLKVKCKLTAGASTATEARISFPNSLTSASTTLIPSITQAGPGLVWNHATTYDYIPLIEPSVGYFTFGRQGAAAGLTKLNGSSLAASGQTMTFVASAPISTWTENQNAPLISGIVSSSYSGQLRSEVASISSAGVVTEVSGDWISGNCSVSGTSIYDCTMVSGLWASAPVCTITAESASAVVGKFGNGTQTTTAFQVITFLSTTGAATASKFFIGCTGQRP